MLLSYVYKIKICLLLFFFLLSSSLSATEKYQIYWYHSQLDTIKPHTAHQLNYKLLDEAYSSPSLYQTGIYWFKIRLNKTVTETDILHLLIENPHLDTVYFYQRKAGVELLQQVSGNNFKKKDSTYLRYTQFTFKPIHEDIYLKTNFKKDVLFPVKISSETRFQKEEQINFFRLGLYYGFVMMVLAVNSFFYFTFRDAKYIFYCIFLFLIALTFAYSDGLAVFISRDAGWLNHADLGIHLLVVAAGAIFATSFLEIDRVYPKIKWVGVVLWVIMFTVYVVHLLEGGRYLFYIGHISGLLLLSLYWFAGVFRFNKDVFARFFVIAYGFLLIIAYDFFWVRELGWQFLNMTHNQLKLASILEMIVLSLTITYRVRMLQKENRYYRDEINRYIKQTLETTKQTGEKQQETLENIREQFDLTARELEVLEKIMQGFSNSEIGEELFLSVNTVKYHIRNIYNKLEINSREEVINLLRES